MKDVLGNEIRPGDVIAWAVRHYGGRPGLRLGTVLKVDRDKSGNERVQAQPAKRKAHLHKYDPFDYSFDPTEPTITTVKAKPVYLRNGARIFVTHNWKQVYH